MPTDPAAANLPTAVHGVLLSIYGLGVLLRGPSGRGKSTLALQLVQRGHALVSDDVPLLMRNTASIAGSSDPILQGLLHVRGLGVLDVVRLFGRRAVRAQQRLDMVLHLTEAQCPSPELQTPRRFCSILGLSFPELCIAADTPQLADLTESLLRAELAQRHHGKGHDILQQRLDAALRPAPSQAVPSQAAAEHCSCV